MRGLSRFSLSTVTMLVCVLNDANASSERWATYKNSRFGTTAEYPADLFTVFDPPPENGDGQGFRTPDGRSHLSVYGAWNVEGHTPETYISNYVDLAGASVTYRRVTDRFYVISGTRDGNIFYDRCNFSADPKGIIDCLTISYPEQEKSQWSPIVSRLSKSLRAGPSVPDVVAQTARSETEQGFLGFKTPSGKIQCMFDASDGEYPPYVRCDMAEMTNPIPPKPSSCDLDWGNAFSITEEGIIGERICAGDTIFSDSWEVLPYGSTWQQQGFTCLSERSGLTCFNAKRHGFTLSRSSQKLF